LSDSGRRFLWMVATWSCMCDCPASTTRPDLPSHWQYPTRCGVSETNRLEALGQCIPPSQDGYRNREGTIFLPASRRIEARVRIRRCVTAAPLWDGLYRMPGRCDDTRWARASTRCRMTMRIVLSPWTWNRYHRLSCSLRVFARAKSEQWCIFDRDTKMHRRAGTLCVRNPHTSDGHCPTPS